MGRFAPMFMGHQCWWGRLSDEGGQGFAPSASSTRMWAHHDGQSL